MTAEETKNLWGEELYKIFANYFDEEGWLTNEWVDIIEENLSDWDENFNDTFKKREIYGTMYNLNFEDSSDGKYIRPIKEEVIDETPKRIFLVNEEINHKKHGIGKVKEVFETMIIILFSNGKEQKFMTYLFEQNLI